MKPKVHLSTGPLDDYQRTVFSPGTSHNIPFSTQWPSTISKNSYKTNLLRNVINIPVLGSIVSKPVQPCDKRVGDQNRIQTPGTGNMLHCLEYVVPEIEVNVVSDGEPKKNTISSILCKVEEQTPNIPTDDHSNDTQTSSDTQGKDKTIVYTDEQEKIDQSSCKNIISLKNEGMMEPQTEKDDFEAHQDTTPETTSSGELGEGRARSDESSALFDTGCTVIWSEDIDFVYMTGIWKIYQKVMDRLISINRKTKERNEASKQSCMDEWNNICINIFGRRSVSYSRSRISSSQNLSSTNCVVNEHKENDSATEREEMDDIVATIKPFDFKWEKVETPIREQLLAYYKKYLIQVKRVNPSLLESMETFEIAQKLRGGYTHIQGTWLPIQLARRLCLMFAYPIRYLLVPVFGSTFPEECEKWYAFYESNKRETKAFISSFDGTILEGFRGTESYGALNSNGQNPHLTDVVNVVEQLTSGNFRTQKKREGKQLTPSPSVVNQQKVSWKHDGGQHTLAQLKQLSQDNIYFRPGKKASKVEKRSHQNNKILRYSPSADQDVGIQPETQLAPNVNTVTRATITPLDPFIPRPNVGYCNLIESFAMQERVPVQPNGIHSRAIYGPHQTAGRMFIGNASIPPTNMLNGRIQHGRDAAMLADTQPVPHGQVPHQSMGYRMPLVPMEVRFGNGGAVFVLPNQPHFNDPTVYFRPQYAMPTNGWNSQPQQYNYMHPQHNNIQPYNYANPQGNNIQNYSGVLPYSPGIPPPMFGNNSIHPTYGHVPMYPVQPPPYSLDRPTGQGSYPCMTNRFPTAEFQKHSGHHRQPKG